MLQVRVQRSHPQRVRAGAPEPTRSLTPEELVANLRFFTEGMRGPRTRPSDRLILSGVGVAARDDVPQAIALARSLGVARVVLHAGTEDLDSLDIQRYRGLIDVLVIPAQPQHLSAVARLVGRCAELGVRAVTNTLLDAQTVTRLELLSRGLAESGTQGAALTFPFPERGVASAELPRVPELVPALVQAVKRLGDAGVQADIKGLPACYLGPLASLTRRSANRWYVDAEHQLGEAILFFPEVVRFTKSEQCRFCASHSRCDGFFAEYLRDPRFPALQPLER